MKKLLLSLALCLAPTLAWAQGCGNTNPNCIVPTAPLNTSNNQAASTAFVKNAVGGGSTFGTGTYSSPVDVGTMVVTGSLVKYLVGSTGTPYTTDPPSPNIVTQLITSVADGNTITTPLLGSCIKTSSNAVAWCTGIVGIGQDNASGNGSFVEGLRGVGTTISGAGGIATGVVGTANSTNVGQAFSHLIGIESVVTNVYQDAPVFSSFNPVTVLSVGFLATASTVSGTVFKVDAGFLTNPFSKTQFQAGYSVGVSSVSTTGVAFINWAAVTNGLDLSHGTYSSNQIIGPGFAVSGTGSAFSLTPASGSTFITLNPLAAAQQAGITFQQTSVSKWQMGKDTNDSFFLFDAGRGASDITIPLSGDMTLMGTSGNVVVGTATAGNLTVGGAIRSNSAFIAGGTAPTLTGTCVVVAGTQTGGSTVGKFAIPAGNCVATTTVIASMPTAPTGWSCDAHNLNTPTSVIDQTAVATNSVTYTIRTVTSNAADVVLFKCLAF